MNVEELRRNLTNIPPFDPLSLQVLSLAKRHARVRLTAGAHQNATILSGAGEAASTAAFYATYSDHFEGVMTGLRKAEIDYRRPASGAIVATARIDEEASTALQQLASDNRACPRRCLAHGRGRH
jgi:hypothetical protein